jgi:hypothetical protein
MTCLPFIPDFLLSFRPSFVIPAHAGISYSDIHEILENTWDDNEKKPCDFRNGVLISLLTISS